MTARTYGGNIQLCLRLSAWDSTGEIAIWSLYLRHAVTQHIRLYLLSFQFNISHSNSYKISTFQKINFNLNRGFSGKTAFYSARSQKVKSWVGKGMPQST